MVEEDILADVDVAVVIVVVAVIAVFMSVIVVVDVEGVEPVMTTFFLLIKTPLIIRACIHKTSHELFCGTKSDRPILDISLFPMKSSFVHSFSTKSNKVAHKLQLSQLSIFYVFTIWGQFTIIPIALIYEPITRSFETIFAFKWFVKYFIS